MSNNNSDLFAGFCLTFSNKILDEYLDIMRLNNHSAQENAMSFIAFNAVLQREFLKKLSVYDRNAEEIYKKELERFEKIFSA